MLWFQVLQLKFYSILNWLLYMLWDKDPISFFCMWTSKFPSTTYWRDYPFLIVFLTFCWRSIESKCMNLLLSSLSVFHWSIHLFLLCFVCQCYTALLLSFVIYFEIRVSYLSLCSSCWRLGYSGSNSIGILELFSLFL